MRRRLKIVRNKARKGNSLSSLEHEELVNRAVALGMPAFCGTWARETLERKIMEKDIV